MAPKDEIDGLRRVLEGLRREGKVLIAVLFGSLARGAHHTRSDIDLALYLNVPGEQDDLGTIDRILMSVERDVSILRLDDEEESPFVIQEALRGTHLVEPTPEILYAVAHRALHESEEIRFRRGLRVGPD